MNNESTNAPDLSVVAPVYNEIENLEALVREIHAALEPEGVSFEIVLVDDGSSDGSSEKIAELANAEDSTVRGLHFRENRGQTAAFDAGFKAARGRWVVTIDADLQNDPRDIPKLLERLDDFDAAVA